jgi:hypothetical protein
MKKLTIINVNLQDGLLLSDEHVVGGFNRHNNVVILSVPWNKSDFEFPNELETFEVITRRTDSISLTYWTPDGYKTSFEIKSINQTIHA